MASQAAELHAAEGKRLAAVFVVGPDEAATAFCAAVLGLLGARPPSAREFEAQCERVLDLFGRASASPVADFPLPPAWWADRRLDDLLPEARRLLGPGMPLLAEPRLARLLPFWLRAAREAGFAPRTILVVCPTGPWCRAEFRALDTLTDSLRYSASCKRCRVAHSEWCDDPAAALRRLIALLAPDSPPPMADLVAGVAALDRQGLHAADRAGPAVRHPLVQHVFDTALAAADIEEAASRLAPFVEQFVTFRQLLGGFEQEHAATARALAAATALARDGQERGRALEKALNAVARLERASVAAERVRLRSDAELEASRGAEATAEARVRRLEDDLAAHASALGETLAKLRDAEARAASASRPAGPPALPQAPRRWRRVFGLG